jgi:hypothetical protein
MRQKTGRFYSSWNFSLIQISFHHSRVLLMPSVTFASKKFPKWQTLNFVCVSFYSNYICLRSWIITLRLESNCINSTMMYKELKYIQQKLLDPETFSPSRRTFTNTEKQSPPHISMTQWTLHTPYSFTLHIYWIADLYIFSFRSIIFFIQPRVLWT